MFKLSKYFTKGKGNDKISKQEKTQVELVAIYEQTYGYDFQRLIPRLKKMFPMKMVEVTKVKHAIYILNIMRHEPWLVWIARLYVALPLPDGWERIENQNSDPEQRDLYQNWFTKQIVEVRPCYGYISRLIEEARKNKLAAQKVGRIWMINQDHIFEDGFGRVFTVDNAKMFQNQVDDEL